MLDALTKINNSKLLNISLVWDENKPVNPSHVYKELKLKNFKNF